MTILPCRAPRVFFSFTPCASASALTHFRRPCNTCSSPAASAASISATSFQLLRKNRTRTSARSFASGSSVPAFPMNFVQRIRSHPQGRKLSLRRRHHERHRAYRQRPKTNRTLFPGSEVQWLPVCFRAGRARSTHQRIHWRRYSSANRTRHGKHQSRGRGSRLKSSSRGEVHRLPQRHERLRRNERSLRKIFHRRAPSPLHGPGSAPPQRRTSRDRSHRHPLNEYLTLWPETRL